MRQLDETFLGDLVQVRAERDPDRDVLTFEHLSLDGGRTPDEVRTYSDLWRRANRLAAELRRRGLRRGDRFALMMRNHPEFVEAMIAASITSTVFVPLDPRTAGPRLAFMLRHSASRGIIIADYALAQLQAVRSEVPGLEWALVLASGEDGVASTTQGSAQADDLSSVLDGPDVFVDTGTRSATDALQIIYTSGTTGDSKGIVGDQRRMTNTSMVAHLFGYQADERPYTGLSFSHINAQTTALLPALTYGYRSVYSRRFTKSRLWDVCRRHGCTTFSLLGGMATAIFAEPPRADDRDNPVRLVISGGMPAAIWSAFEARFGVKIFEIYGASDGGGMACNPPGTGPVGSFGKPVFGVQMKVLDDDGNECAPGVTGEICCRPGDGSDASVEYFGDAAASQRKIRAGWNRSGDMGHRDAAGWLYFDYRKGGGIRRNGDFIDPALIERTLAEDPQIDDVFVYGVPARSGAPGEREIVAAIVPVDAARFDRTAVLTRCRELLERTFVPDWLQVVSEIPKTASEKPQERILAEAFGNGGAGIHESR